MAEDVCEQYVRRYLMAHNYSRTLAALSVESANDSLNDCFQPSKVINNINEAIYNLDYEALTRMWKGLEACFYSRLDSQRAAKFDSLKAYTYKTLLCAAVKAKRTSCVTAFFTNQTDFDLTSPTWNNWTALPFVMDPAKHDSFCQYFTKTWDDVLNMSLSNFLCVLFRSLPIPADSNSQSTASMANLGPRSQVQFKLGTLDDFSNIPSVRGSNKR